MVGKDVPKDLTELKVALERCYLDFRRSWATCKGAFTRAGLRLHYRRVLPAVTRIEGREHSGLPRLSFQTQSLPPKEVRVALVGEGVWRGSGDKIGVWRLAVDIAPGKILNSRDARAAAHLLLAAADEYDFQMCVGPPQIVEAAK